MIDNSYNKKSFFRSKGVYLLAALCILAAGAGVWGATRMTKITKSGEETTAPQRRYGIDYSLPQETLTQANNPVKNVPDERTTAPAQTTGESDEKNTPYTGYYALPMGTDIRKDYSAGEMVKNVTTNDWRVHDGIDFGGAAGNDVIAIQSGTVSKVYNDSLWGNVVEIDHGKGLVAKYCGLADKDLPKAGDKVDQFDRIGTLGTVPVEAADGSHLHFSITVNGKTVDPLEAMNKLGTGDADNAETAAAAESATATD